jgi:hypothetical protein
MPGTVLGVGRCSIKYNKQLDERMNEPTMNPLE